MEVTTIMTLDDGEILHHTTKIKEFDYSEEFSVSTEENIMALSDKLEVELSNPHLAEVCNKYARHKECECKSQKNDSKS